MIVLVILTSPSCRPRFSRNLVILLRNNNLKEKLKFSELIAQQTVNLVFYSKIFIWVLTEFNFERKTALVLKFYGYSRLNESVR